MYDPLYAEAFGFMRPWEVRRLTDFQIEGLFGAARRRAAALAKAHPRLYGGSGAGATEATAAPEGVPDQAAGMRDALSAGRFPSRMALVSLLMQMPGATREYAEAEYDRQKALWEKATGRTA